jgi:WD40 repeat protein
VRKLGNAKSPLQYLAWLDGGTKLVAVTRAHRFITWDVARGTVLNTASVAGHGGTILSHLQPLFLAVHPDGQRLASADYHDPRSRPPSPAQIWTLTPTGLKASALPLSANLHGGLAFTPDGTALVGGAACAVPKPRTYVGAIVWWDLHSGKAGAGFAGHAGIAAALGFTADGAYLVSSGGDGYFRLWEVATRKEIGNRKARTVRRDFALAPDGRGLAFIHDHSGAFTLFDPLANKKLGKPVVVVHSTQPLMHVAYSPKNDRVASVGYDGRLCFWARNGSALAAHDLGNGQLDSVAFAPDGRSVAVAAASGFIFLCDVD